MPISRKRPKHATHVRSYAKLNEYATSFAEGCFGLVILVGPAGTAKSMTIRNALGTSALWIEGSATAFGMYTELYKHRGQLVVIDDVDTLYSDKAAVRLLKCLCQTDPVKTVAWYSSAAGMQVPDLPKSFTTTSKVCIICNDWKTMSENTKAVENRGHLLFFEPKADEIHRQTAKWFWDQEIFDWFGTHLHLLPGLSMRHYVRASELKDAGMNWLEVLLSEGFNESAILVAKLKADPRYKTEAERIKAFKELGGGARTTYFKWSKKITPKKQLEHIRLTAKKPTVPPQLTLVQGVG